ncbi:hypothetical protein DFP72DRAFT_1049153 [Ephemerocybe angulata]|uniref:Uncharacterized protein n=1 Tax=Ephemerocybe angulata TaxID=980116 RepID=A0A8H6HL54_9AGAR|nr:hypothetical protein DFP72DRAFT_1049153 [Tulosesus angulatus]
MLEDIPLILLLPHSYSPPPYLMHLTLRQPSASHANALPQSDTRRLDQCTIIAPETPNSLSDPGRGDESQAFPLGLVTKMRGIGFWKEHGSGRQVPTFVLVLVPVLVLVLAFVEGAAGLEDVLAGVGDHRVFGRVVPQFFGVGEGERGFEGAPVVVGVMREVVDGMDVVVRVEFIIPPSTPPSPDHPWTQRRRRSGVGRICWTMWKEVVVASSWYDIAPKSMLAVTATPIVGFAVVLS